MPLVVPGLMGGSQQEEWMTKLLGKKLSDSHDETSFAKQDLPKEHRIVEPGAMVTQEVNSDRLSIHVGEDGTVRHVEYK
ncbi:hypothetical protein G7Y79_00013g034260 [Physcia stellaris]|nr:hypothetical protein G7Y79_00013g034260 [Physcia stellaris]